MMLDFKAVTKKHNANIIGIIQLGCHWWQERDVFISMGINSFVLVEPQKEAFKIAHDAAKGIDAIMFNCAVGNERGIMTMHVDDNNQGQSASLLKPEEHLKEYPTIPFSKKESVDVLLVDDLHFDRDKYNCIVMDLQGAELMAMQGATETLKHIDYIYTEINFIEMYKGCALVTDLDKFLSDFERVETGAYNNGWSDAFYIRKK